jgi:hypothetical protein
MQVLDTVDFFSRVQLVVHNGDEILVVDLLLLVGDAEKALIGLI